MYIFFALLALGLMIFLFAYPVDGNPTTEPGVLLLSGVVLIGLARLSSSQKKIASWPF